MTLPRDEHFDEDERRDVEEQRTELRDFVKSLDPNDLKSGNWFEKLLARALQTYSKTATWEYFKAKYPGVPADGIVEKRIALAARYAALEGGLSAGAFSAAVAATLGSAGGASPLTIPAGVTTVVVDVAYVTQLQIRLAYDIAVLYRVPIDVDDPDDLWKLIKVSFMIKGGEIARGGVLKVVPAAVRPLVKKFVAGPTLKAVQSLPVIGRHLLQRNIIKIGIPLVGIPLAISINYFSTLVAGRHARAVFRDDARITEMAARLMSSTQTPQLLLWTAWLVITADKKIGDREVLLMQQLTKSAFEQHEVSDVDLEHVIDLDPDEAWARLRAQPDAWPSLAGSARKIAEVDGPANVHERAVIDRLSAGATSD